MAPNGRFAAEEAHRRGCGVLSDGDSNAGRVARNVTLAVRLNERRRLALLARTRLRLRLAANQAGTLRQIGGCIFSYRASLISIQMTRIGASAREPGRVETRPAEEAWQRRNARVTHWTLRMALRTRGRTKQKKAESVPSPPFTGLALHFPAKSRARPLSSTCAEG